MTRQRHETAGPSNRSGDQARLRHGVDGLPDEVDLLVVGLGVTGAGVALDAAARGLSVVAVDAHDVAFGTSRWSSKLVHGGLRYLANGQFGVARESAVERGILMERTAPHLVRPLPMLIPLTGATSRGQAALARTGLIAGDLLRFSAGTARDTLPRPRRLTPTETKALAPVVRADVRGGLLSWDGQLEDDARLTLAIARTAAREGAAVHLGVRVESVDRGLVDLHGPSTPGGPLLRRRIRARMVVNATGVWAGQLAPEVRLTPSRGTHLVLRADALPGVRCAVMAPVPGASNRFVFALPQPDQTIYLGLTDDPVEDIEDVPAVPEQDVDFLLQTCSAVLARPLSRADVVGSFAGLRPLLTGGGSTADLSRRHAVLTGDDGTVTVVGGKLTTYRRMAQDAVDAALATLGAAAALPCRTAELPLVGAGTVDPTTPLSNRLRRRFGNEDDLVLANARRFGLSSEEALTPIAPTLAITPAELLFGVSHEGARSVADLLDRRTRVGLVPADREQAVAAAEYALRTVLASA